MNSVITNTVADGSAVLTISSGVATVIAALVALIGALIGITVRDVVMAIYLARKKRLDELADKKLAEYEAHRDLVRLYSDPLKESVDSLRYRLQEIVEKRQGRYLLSDAITTPFNEYKKISTLYRVAAVLGWIRAIRRERSYLDPKQAAASAEVSVISDLEKALADGGHVELQRLDELLILWRVDSVGDEQKAKIAYLIDGERSEYLVQKGVLGARELAEIYQIELAERCASIIRTHTIAEIPVDIVKSTAAQASLIFGIKEAYIYRDWQAAIGDLMLKESNIGSRHFSIIGFGEFEDNFIVASADIKDSSARRWFDRLQALFYDLDMAHEGMFDARRKQLKMIYDCCEKLVVELNSGSRV